MSMRFVRAKRSLLLPGLLCIIPSISFFLVLVKIRYERFYIGYLILSTVVAPRSVLCEALDNAQSIGYCDKYLLLLIGHDSNLMPVYERSVGYVAMCNPLPMNYPILSMVRASPFGLCPGCQSRES